MKALILKDLLAVWKYCRNLLLMCGLFLVSSIFLEEYNFMQMYPVIFVGMLVNTLIAYDERDKWDRLVLTMPVTRRQYVTAKYLVGLLLQGVALLLTAAACALRLAMGSGFRWDVFCVDMGLLLVLACSAPSLMLPAVFKNGSEKGRMAYLIVLGSVFALAAGGTILLKKLNLMQAPVEIPGGPLIVVLMALLYGASWALSVHWYEKREF